MNLSEASNDVRSFVFRTSRVLARLLGGGRISAFGSGPDSIGSVLVLNLDRQPERWNSMRRELARLRTSDRSPLISIATRFTAVDARDGRAVAATADVDPNYHIRDQLYVQPDARLAACFDAAEPVRMTRQEVAVARSHIEMWKAIATGTEEYVLVLEDDTWFKMGAARAIDRGWKAALERCRAVGGPRLVYLSYLDAGGSASRADSCDALFRPKRGLWFLSGYVLSREGARMLLRAMPVVGPVDMWINYRFDELEALALSSPAILQRSDCMSENVYSILPYLARAGVVDFGSGPKPPSRSSAGPVVAWTAAEKKGDGLAMALSMLGLRVRSFDRDEEAISQDGLTDNLRTFDALIDPPMTPSALSRAMEDPKLKFIEETSEVHPRPSRHLMVPPSRITALPSTGCDDNKWRALCDLLALTPPTEPFPRGAHRTLRLFRDDRRKLMGSPLPLNIVHIGPFDDSPWVLPIASQWQPRNVQDRDAPNVTAPSLAKTMSHSTYSFPALTETFPGNLANFTHEQISWDEQGTHLQVLKVETGERPYRSGAFASATTFAYGRFEAEIRAARGSGLLTGFFLPRHGPRQEIDIELKGDDPRIMLINVFFNPGEEGASMAFGYRGTPLYIDLGFDATEDFHHYTIEWRSNVIRWAVDGRTVHERFSWDPTPIPHLPMRLHANLWVPRSRELAGKVDESALPGCASFKNVSIFE